MTYHRKSAKLRELLSAGPPIRVIGAHDALGARIGELAGFDAIWASGLEISAAHCVPDANVLTMTEFRDCAFWINRACNIPVICDCDTGYGSAANVMRVVEEYEAAGIAAICIEDKVFPKMNSLVDGRQELASISDFAGKIAAAKHVQKSDEFVIIARVEALIAGWGMNEALKRAHAYAEAGADVILIHSKKREPDEVLQFIASWDRPTPVAVVPTTYYETTLARLADAGAKIVIYANFGLRAAITAMKSRYLEILETGSTASIEPKIAPLTTVFELQGMPQLQANQERFTGVKSEIEAIFLAAGDSGDKQLAEFRDGRPVCTLDIAGKSLLQRNIETLDRIGISRAAVVIREDRKYVSLPDINVIVNHDATSTGIAGSLIMATQNLWSEKALIVFGDVLFESDLIEALLPSKADCILAIAASRSEFTGHPGKIDQVLLHRDEGIDNTRGNSRIFTIAQIGKSIQKTESEYEFIGVALMTNTCLKKSIEIVESRAADGAPTSFNDLVNELIKCGDVVEGMEVQEGWIEVHTYSHYLEAVKHFGN